MPAANPQPLSAPYLVEFVSEKRTVQFGTTSDVLRADEYHDATIPHVISSEALQIYGDLDAPNVIRIGNGGLGPTGLVQLLCERYLKAHHLEGQLRIEWVCNHSRHTQIALQAGVVDIALTYERSEERTAEREGWSKTVDFLCHDHFVLVGPKEDPADVSSHHGIACAMHAIGRAGEEGRTTFQTRGDGSATMHKEHALWGLAGVTPEDRNASSWYQRIVSTPFDALVRANKDKAYLLNDRATFLLAKHRGVIPDMTVFVEGGDILMNSCAICVRSDEKREEIWRLVRWMLGEEAQEMVRTYGNSWEAALPLVTAKEQEEVSKPDQVCNVYPACRKNKHSHNLALTMSPGTTTALCLAATLLVGAVSGWGLFRRR